MELSIVILNYNGKHWLKDCLESIFKNTANANFEILIVDNASTDGSVEYIKTTFPLVKIIENKTNLGFTRGNNIGVKEAVGEYLCILNNDTIVLPNALDNLLSFIKSRPAKTIVTGKILRFDGIIQQNCTNFPKFLQEYINFTFAKLKGPNPLGYHLKHNIIQEVEVISGTFFMIKRKDMLKLGGFDENIFIFYEDADLCLRFRKMGGYGFYYPNSVIKHYWGGYYKSSPLEGVKLSYRSIIYYFHKHYGKIYSFIFNFTVKASIIVFICILSSLVLITIGRVKKLKEKNSIFLGILKSIDSKI